MNENDDFNLSVARVMSDAAALGDAALSGDFDEARFRAHLVVDRARALGLRDVASAGEKLISALGPAGTHPSLGYGVDILRVTDALDSIPL